MIIPMWKRERQRQVFFTHWLTLQTAARASAVPSNCQKPQASSRSLICVAGAQTLGHLLLFSGASAGSCIGSAVAVVSINTHMGENTANGVLSAMLQCWPFSQPSTLVQMEGRGELKLGASLWKNQRAVKSSSSSTILCTLRRLKGLTNQSSSSLLP